MKTGPKHKYQSEEEYREAKRNYNKRYYGKKADELKAKRTKDKDTDDDIKAYIDRVGWQRIINLMI